MSGWWGGFGFSWVGLVFMLSLEIPNILWARRQPLGYDSAGESKALRIFERVGQVFCTATVLLFSNPMSRGIGPWLGWLIAAIALMLLYEGFWVRYFRGSHSLRDFYRPLYGIPVPGALLPVLAFLLLGIYGRSIPLIISAIILGIGHVGIHLHHAQKMAELASDRAA